MILTGPKIEECLSDGSIVIDPLGDNLVGPNSVDLRLHAEMKVYGEEISGGMISPTAFAPLDVKRPFPTYDICIPSAGYVLQPERLYLARTMEKVGSDKFVPMVEGRSSCGRLGLQVHMTAGFCDTGFFGTITLEMTVVHPLRIYPATAVAQVFFLRPEGEIRLYKGRYQGHVEATASLMHEKRKGAGR
jgi:dCTP deaminase